MKYLFLLSALLCTQFTVMAQRLPRSVEVVAITILDEARGEGQQGMYAVGCVIRNRMGQRNRSAEAMSLERLQFSGWWYRAANSRGYLTWYRRTVGEKRWLLNEPSAAYAVRLAYDLVNWAPFDQRITGYADSFTSAPSRTWWTRGKRPTAVIGRHYFYRV